MTSGPDPTRIREQPALTRSRGTIWLVVGGLFAAVALAMLIPMTRLPNGGVALASAIVVAALYLGMVVARLAVPEARRRLNLLAIGMLLIAAVSLTGVAIVAASAWEGVIRR